MSKIISYFEEKVNNCLLNLESLEHKLKMVNGELRELDNRVSNIDMKMSDSDFVFNVGLYNNSLNDSVLADINSQKDECLADKSEIESLIENAKSELDFYRDLYKESEMLLGNNESRLFSQLEFVKKLIDTEPQRAKIEIDRILKEEK